MRLLWLLFACLLVCFLCKFCSQLALLPNIDFSEAVLEITYSVVKDRNFFSGLSAETSTLDSSSRAQVFERHTRHYAETSIIFSEARLSMGSALITDYLRQSLSLSGLLWSTAARRRSRLRQFRNRQDLCPSQRGEALTGPPLTTRTGTQAVENGVKPPYSIAGS